MDRSRRQPFIPPLNNRDGPQDPRKSKLLPANAALTRSGKKQPGTWSEADKMKHILGDSAATSSVETATAEEKREDEDPKWSQSGSQRGSQKAKGFGAKRTYLHTDGSRTALNAAHARSIGQQVEAEDLDDVDEDEPSKSTTPKLKLPSPQRKRPAPTPISIPTNAPIAARVRTSPSRAASPPRKLQIEQVLGIKIPPKHLPTTTSPSKKLKLPPRAPSPPLPTLIIPKAGPSFQRSLEVKSSPPPSSPSQLKLCPLCSEQLPEDLQSKVVKGISVKEMYRIHRTHRAQSTISSGLKKGYPEHIAWSGLRANLNRLLPDLRAILAGNLYSSFMSDAKTASKPASQEGGRGRGSGSKLRNQQSLALLATDFESNLPGYYGPHGARVIASHLLTHLAPEIRSTLDSDPNLAAMGLSLFTQSVLVPEAGVRLIMEDRGCGCGWEEAREVMRESVEFGDLVHGEKDGIEEGEWDESFDVSMAVEEEGEGEGDGSYDAGSVLDDEFGEGRWTQTQTQKPKGEERVEGERTIFVLSD
ncbi:hypothetical protein SAICODRAFT_4337 [Saitoella complicata NRRL Y-17804]|uniref:uncharacterized protein n=1 Tax=Saitoella complicata (strain BCRC 22490 / CBS 7301 / JCM 7358 / NBRC 10748 / NRRL Y-17804) TaxID=698492 RepID=UPI0008670109|nr:uncharacterized protein SAICODRAFT_4337 [Saitoella complicata NRRL Y-17804]ODQ56140.1 hypothetical protein SAICODRAFT_4337 [Saitoella complicata NRRL Y-17804]